MAQKIRQDISIGKNLRRIRKENKMTQEQVVAKLQTLGLDITRSVYSQIECGSYNIRVSELVALQKIYKISFNDIFSNLEVFAEA